MICEAIVRGRDLIFCGEPNISIYFTDIKSFFNLDNLEPASGRPDPELEVKAYIYIYRYIRIEGVPMDILDDIFHN